MARAAKCYLIPSDKSLSNISIPNGVEVVVGRSRETNIKETLCSRKQLSLLADYDKSELLVKSIGVNPAAIDGRVTEGNIVYTIKNGSVIDFVAGFLKYIVKFEHIVNNIGNRAKRMMDDYPTELKLKQLRVSKESNNTSFIEQNSNTIKNNSLWKDCYNETLLEFTSCDFVYSNKVASFDLDSTLIKTKSGYVFPKDNTDWMLWNPIVKTQLGKLNQDGYMLVIFTNQAGLAPPNGFVKIPNFKSKIERIVSELAIPVKVLISITHGLYRKPAPGMWHHLVKTTSVPIMKKNSFYVGDAAGRINNWKPGKKKDFAMSDRLFALNLNLNFYTPEEYFFKEPKALYSDIPFTPADFVYTAEPNYGVPSIKQEVIVMAGSPASGKSSFVSKKLVAHGYIKISRDNVGSWQKCVKDLEKELSLKRNVVIDNTNPDSASRSRYVQVCRQLNIPVRCFVMDCSVDRAIHNNAFRTIIDKTHQIVTSKIIQGFYSNFETPSLEEGFSEILYIPFIPNFNSTQDEELYFCHLHDKK